MRITLNGREAETVYKSAFGHRDGKDDVVILNGYQLTEDAELREGDTLCVIKKGVMPARETLESMMAARHSPGVHEKLKKGRVAIAGLGGLGSNIAVMLARMGVGELLLVDFDVVEPSNLNRQDYDLTHLGMLKTEAIRSRIEKINPFIEVKTSAVRITEENAREILGDYPIVCEAFDSPQSKAMLINSLLCTQGVKVIAASGMAGFGSANEITTTRKFKNLYISGDSKTEAQLGIGLMAPRVQICAGHQANMAVRLLLGIDAE